jgi:hypothetical protein
MSDSATAKFREARAVELKTVGGTYQQIADELGYKSRSGAWHAVNRALAKRTSAAVDAYRARSLVDLELLESKAWGAAMRGDLSALGQCLTAIDRRARLLGLYN